MTDSAGKSNEWATLAQVLKRNNNNFDLVRLIASLMVVFSHSFDLFESGNFHDPLKVLSGTSSGTLAVRIFFFLSGLFIAGSFLNTSRLSFIAHRIFRIWPALIICVFLSVFVLGSLATTLPFPDYISAAGTWKFLFSEMFLYHVTTHFLPGVQFPNYFVYAINGSLWTLPYEVRCYFLVFAGGIIGVFGNKIFMTLVFLLAAADFAWLHLDVPGFLDDTIVLLFIAGATVYMYKDVIVMDVRISLLLILLAVLSYSTVFFYLILYAAIMYCVLVIGSSALFKAFKLPGDYSYGMYIFSFPMQQAIVKLFPQLNAYAGLAVTLPLVGILAVASWHFIENPAINYGKRLKFGRGEKAKIVQPFNT